tara:strand:- start:129 stop:329 length:201 start_codon:yes stop_codon:yes gene_type:complete
MLDTSNFNIGLAVIAFSFGVLGGAMLMAISVQNTWSYDAAQTECARFSPKTGHFEWIPTKIKVPSR